MGDSFVDEELIKMLNLNISFKKTVLNIHCVVIIQSNKTSSVFDAT